MIIHQNEIQDFLVSLEENEAFGCKQISEWIIITDESDYVLDSRCLRKEKLYVKGKPSQFTSFKFNPMSMRGAKLFIGLSGTQNKSTVEAV